MKFVRNFRRFGRFLMAQLNRWRRKVRVHSESLKIRDFFRDTDRLSVGQTWQFRLIVIVSLILCGLYIYAALHPDEQNHLTWKTRLSPALNFLASLALSVFASLIVVSLINRSNLLRIETVRRLAKQDILENLFNVLRGFDGKYAEKKRISVEFQEPMVSASGFLAAKCVHMVHQRVKPVRDKFILEFDRLSRASGGQRVRNANLLSQHRPDDLYSIDVTDTSAEFDESEAELFPGITEVFINSAKRPLIEERTGSRSRWTFDIRDAYLQDDMIDVEYRYEYTQEISGYTFFEALEPTFGFICSMDFRKASAVMSCYHLEMIHSTRATHSVENHVGQIVVSCGDWVLPRSSVVFCWYKNADYAASFERLTTPQVLRRSDKAEAMGDARSLSADGNCLGVALMRGCELSGLQLPEGDLSLASSTADAVRLLSSVRPPKLLVRRDAALWERFLQSIAAMRLQINTKDIEELGTGDVILCLRSMRQLYGFNNGSAHWVVLEVRHGELVLHDELWRMIRTTHARAQRASAADVLRHRGPSFLI